MLFARLRHLGFYSPLLLLGHAHTLTWCVRDDPVRAAPAQKDILLELRHTVHNDNSLRVTSLCVCSINTGADCV